MSDLSRWGIEWLGPKEPAFKVCEDGYWTPWHIATAEIERLHQQEDKLRNTVIAAEQRVIELLNPWQDISTAPRDGTPILVGGGTYIYDSDTFGMVNKFRSVSVAAWTDRWDSGWQGENCGGHDEFFWYSPTHWMPLPTPPEGGE